VDASFVANRLTSRAAFVSIQEENAGSLYLSHERRKASVEDLDRAMQKNADFFEQ